MHEILQLFCVKYKFPIANRLAEDNIVFRSFGSARDVAMLQSNAILELGKLETSNLDVEPLTPGPEVAILSLSCKRQTLQTNSSSSIAYLVAVSMNLLNKFSIAVMTISNVAELGYF